MPTVDFSLIDRIATVTFKRPEALNALNQETLDAVSKTLKAIQYNPEVSVVVLTGHGEKAFVAGADIKEMSEMTTKEALQFSKKGQGILFQLEEMPQVTIAAVNGLALGGGCEFALACDLIYASENAKFGQPEVNLGVIPGFGGTQRLMRLINPMKARELIFTGNLIDANEALRLGLVAQIFPKEKLLEEVNSLAKNIITKSPEAIRLAKKTMREGFEVSLAKGCNLEQEYFAQCFAHPDQKEGMAAFMEKRKPSWEKAK